MAIVVVRRRRKLVSPPNLSTRKPLAPRFERHYTKRAAQPYELRPPVLDFAIVVLLSIIKPKVLEPASPSVSASDNFFFATATVAKHPVHYASSFPLTHNT